MANSNIILTVVLPTYMRPVLFLRTLNCCLTQTMKSGWELFIVGDGCPFLAKLMQQGEFWDKLKRAEANGNKIHVINWEKNYGGWGYKACNHALQHGSGKYYMEVGDDDIILSKHFETRVAMMQQQQADIMFFDDIVDYKQKLHRAGSMGDSNYIVKTELLRGIDKAKEYGHDLDLMRRAMERSKKTIRAAAPKLSYDQRLNNDLTYVVTSFCEGTYEEINDRWLIDDYEENDLTLKPSIDLYTMNDEEVDQAISQTIFLFGRFLAHNNARNVYMYAYDLYYPFKDRVHMYKKSILDALIEIAVQRGGSKPSGINGSAKPGAPAAATRPQEHKAIL
jgi:glycosyltransferase involved in cell wall biosynthesis